MADFWNIWVIIYSDVDAIGGCVLLEMMPLSEAHSMKSGRSTLES